MPASDYYAWIRTASRSENAVPVVAPPDPAPAAGCLTVAEFCRRLGVSTVTFYAWKRRFREVPAAPSLVPEKPSARPRPEANDASTPAFLPVSILDAGAAGQLEIELANACIVRLKGAVDPELLRIAIHAAGRINGDAVASLTMVTS
jgi:transposase-like protein